MLIVYLLVKLSFIMYVDKLLISVMRMKDGPSVSPLTCHTVGSESRSKEVRVFLRWADDFSSRLTVAGFSRLGDAAALGYSPCCLHMTVWLRCVTLSLLRPVTTEDTADLHNNCSTACSRSALTSSMTWKRKFYMNNKDSACWRFSLLATTIYGVIEKTPWCPLEATMFIKVLDRTNNFLQFMVRIHPL